jgi:hypothetical protein
VEAIMKKRWCDLLEALIAIAVLGAPAVAQQPQRQIFSVEQAMEKLRLPPSTN